MLVTQREAAAVKVPVCVALALLNQGKSSIVLDLGNIYLAESDGKNERQMATIWFWHSGIYEDRLCREAGHNYRKTRQYSKSIVKFEHRLHLLYVGRGKMCKNKKKNEKLNPL